MLHLIFSDAMINYY